MTSPTNQPLQATGGRAISAGAAGILMPVIPKALNGYTIQDVDNNLIYGSTDAGAATVTCPAGLELGTVVTVYQMGAGQVTFVAGAGASVVQASGYTKTRAQYGLAQVQLCAPNVWVLTGDVA